MLQRSDTRLSLLSFFSFARLGCLAFRSSYVMNLGDSALMNSGNFQSGDAILSSAVVQHGIQALAQTET